MTAPLPLPGSLEDLIAPGLWAYETCDGDYEPRGGVIIAVHRTDRGTEIETVRRGTLGTIKRHRLRLADIAPHTVVAGQRARTELHVVEQRLTARLPPHHDQDAYRHVLDLIRTVRRAKEQAT